MRNGNSTPGNNSVGKHAMVLGGSMAGLLAARVLSDYFERVTLIERDQLPQVAENRKGVPQGQHLHVLLAKGEHILSRLFSGLREELIRNGAVYIDHQRDMLWYQGGDYICRAESGIRMLLMSRPLLETTVRHRVLALGNVSFQDGCDVQHLVASGDKKRVTGVRIRRRGSAGNEEVLTADLIVDATGRGSRSPQWLESLGYGRPPESVVKIDVGYATRIYRRDTSLFPDAIALMITAAPPSGMRGGAMGVLEGDRWIVTLGGWLGDHPPTDDQGFLEYARSLPAANLYQVISHAEPLSDIMIHKLPSNLRRHYEKMKHFPDGYLVLGDAMCSFNPIYGQGMTVASLQVEVLETGLKEAAQRGRLEGLSRKFFKRAAVAIKNPWTLAVGEDFRFPGVQGPKPPGTDQINRYVLSVNRTAHHNREVARHFFQVMHMIHPPTALFHPRVVLQVIWNRVLRRGQQRPGISRSTQKVAEV